MLCGGSFETVVLGKNKFVKMDGFLEANRVMEVSLTKLNGIHKSGDLPLRKTLLISKVLNRAQDVATSAHFSILRSSSVSTTSSSKLLASISQDRSGSEETLPTGPARLPARGGLRRQSPIASAALASSKYDDDSMDFENVSSVLSDILDMEMAPAAISCDEEEPVQEEVNTFASEGSQYGGRAAKRSKLLDVSNSTETNNNWSTSTWQFELNTELRNCWKWTSGEEDLSLTVSPGKREHKVAFPFDQENSLFWDSGLEESKRFKPSPPEGCPLESLPGYCGCLSPKNLQSAPLVSYMFGKGYSDPINTEREQQCDWPELSLVDSGATENHFISPSLQTSPIKFSPIMAF